MRQRRAVIRAPCRVLCLPDYSLTLLPRERATVFRHLLILSADYATILIMLDVTRYADMPRRHAIACCSPRRCFAELI